MGSYSAKKINNNGSENISVAIEKHNGGGGNGQRKHQWL
jgi:hypothetical protein